MPFAVMNILSNILSVLFSLVSLTMVIPFLGILFETQEKVYNPPPFSLSADIIKENFYAIISSTIDEKGKVEALLFICILVLVTFFFRNLFRYLALFFLTPIRNGVVHDLRMDLHKNTNKKNIKYQDIRDDRVHTYFDLEEGKDIKIKIHLNASYLGKFYLPIVNCEGMYDNAINAKEGGGWVEVIKESAQ